MAAAAQRISIIGISGAGKTTLSRTLATRLGVERLELDAIQHQAGWREIDPEEFRRRVRAFVEAPRWVIDGNYEGVGVLDIVWERADTVIWLDLPKPLIMRRVAWRSLRRLLTREELWNGNRERLRELMSLDPHRSIVMWAWYDYDRKRAKYEERFAEAKWQHLRLERLRSPAEVRDWLAANRE